MIGIECLDFSGESKLETIQHVSEYKSFQLKSIPRAMDLSLVGLSVCYTHLVRDPLNKL